MSATPLAAAQSPAKDDVARHIASLPNGVIIKCLGTFHNKFPELSILHLPTLSKDLEKGGCPASEALLSAVLAVIRRQLVPASMPWARSLLDGDVYAAHAKKLLGELMLETPRIEIVQALLIVTLHEWGTRDFHKAWVYCGESTLT